MEDLRQACVSVVIPTRNRPAMVVAAVESALAQTEGLLEVIVVIDGPDSSTVAALAVPQADRRLRVLALDASIGGAEARNHGVRQARGDWVAFLDDDDLWLPQKLSVQLGLAKRSRAQNLVIASAVLARGPSFQAIWPRRLYRLGESMAEYLFCREGWTYGAALLQTSTLLAPRALLLRVPFAAGLKKHQDWDWLLRVSADPGLLVLQSPEPLVIFHVEGNRPSVGRRPTGSSRSHGHRSGVSCSPGGPSPLSLQPSARPRPRAPVQRSAIAFGCSAQSSSKARLRSSCACSASSFFSCHNRCAARFATPFDS